MAVCAYAEAIMGLILQRIDYVLDLANLSTEVAPALAFIDKKWDDLRTNARHGHRDRFASWCDLAKYSSDGHLDDTDPENPYILYLPHDFVTPGGRFMVQFYWDSYFIILSLLRRDRVSLARGMVENCFFSISRHGMVIANRKRWAAGSQLPFLSQMVREIYQVTRDREWLISAIPFVEQEFTNHWLDAEHLVECGLSRYHAPPCFPREHIGAITIDNEATWDLSPRFDASDVLSLLPVDLNCNLYAYERDLSDFYRELGNERLAHKWQQAATRRADLMNSRMWDEQDGLYYDYNYCLKTRKRVKSLATYFPLFYGVADASQARKVVSNIGLFEGPGGLATCDQDYGYRDRQWNYPIGWAPLHLVAYKGMMLYGFKDDATRIALKWLSFNYRVWQRTGSFFEKYDVIAQTHEVLTDRYDNQRGFGWTNAVFDCLVSQLETSRGTDTCPGSDGD